MDKQRTEGYSYSRFYREHKDTVTQRYSENTSIQEVFCTNIYFIILKNLIFIETRTYDKYIVYVLKVLLMKILVDIPDNV